MRQAQSTKGLSKRDTATTACTPRRAIAARCAIVIFVFGGFAGSARAQAPLSDTGEVQRPAFASAREGFFLPQTFAAGGDRTSPGVATALGGYDGGRESAQLGLRGDVKLIGPVDVRLGLAYTPEVEEGEAQPHFGARVRILDQADHNLDLSVGLLYRMERFTDDEGLIQGVVAAGRRWGRLGIFANAGYGQDPEGDDREAEFALAGLYTLDAPVQLGVESSLRIDVLSDDPKREAREDSDLEVIAGPVAHFSLGPIGFLAQAGIHAVKVDGMRAGALVLGGISYAH